MLKPSLAGRGATYAIAGVESTPKVDVSEA